MPDQVFAPAVPHNPRNYMIPSRVSLWWQSVCPDGSLDDPVELGSVSNIEFTPNETTQELKSFRTGIQTTDFRVVTDVSGTVSFQLHELVGTNLQLLLRPVTIEQKGVGNEETIYEQVRVRLTGTTPVEIDPRAVEYDPVSGTVTKPQVTILAVESTAIADGVTGRGTAYTGGGVDYSFVNVSGGTLYGIEFTDDSSGVVPDVGATLTADQQTLAYDGGTGGLPQIGGTVTGGTSGATAVIDAYVGDEVSGILYVSSVAGGPFQNNEALTQGSFAALANGANVAAATATVVSVGSFSGGIGEILVTVSSATGFAAGVTFTGDDSSDGTITSFVNQGADTGATIARVGAGAISDGEEVVVRFSYPRRGTSYSMLDGVVLEGALRLQVMSLNGPQSVYIFNRVNIQVEGAISLNPEERLQPTLQATILPDGQGQRGRMVLLDGFSKFALTDCAA